MENIVSVLKQKEGFFSRIPASNEKIEEAERILKLKFAPEYRDYLSAFGAASFCGYELTGLCKIPQLNVVTVTLEEKKYHEVPAAWYVIEQAHIDDIVVWQNEAGEIFQTGSGAGYTKIYGSLREYIDA